MRGGFKVLIVHVITSYAMSIGHRESIHNPAYADILLGFHAYLPVIPMYQRTAPTCTVQFQADHNDQTLRFHPLSVRHLGSLEGSGHG